MDNLEFHVLFNIPEAVVQTINQMIYKDKEVVKVNMIRKNVQEDIQEILDGINFKQENCVCHVIELESGCSMLTFFINNGDNVEIRTLKMTMHEGGMPDEKNN